MKRIRRLSILLLLVAGQSVPAYEAPQFPYAPAAGQPGSAALAHNDPSITGWAISVDSVLFGEEVADEWRNTDEALGPATAVPEGVLVLGRGGHAVLAFEGVIRDGDGFDFAVFENALADTFLELAFVEVSSDGIHYVRFPSYSVTSQPVGPFGSVLATYVHGLAGKYRIGFGTPFDLAVLSEAHAAALAGEGGFSDAYRAHLLEAFPFLNLQAVRFVKVVDIAGDGRESDCEGFAIYDPYPTVITSGFDLDAVAVINGAEATAIPSFDEWAQAFAMDADPLADPDQDGWSNYLEYLLDANPLSALSLPVVSISFENAGDAASFTIAFSRRAVPGSSPIVQTSPDMSAWTEWTGARQVRTDPVHPEGGFVRESVTIPVNESAQTLMFARLNSRMAR